MSATVRHELRVFAECNVYDCENPARGSHPCLTIAGVPFMLGLCDAHRLLFDKWSAFGQEAQPCKVGVGIEEIAAVHTGAFDDYSIPVATSTTTSAERSSPASSTPPSGLVKHQPEPGQVGSTE